MKERNSQNNKRSLFTVLLLCGIAAGMLIGCLITVLWYRNPGITVRKTEEYTIESEADAVLCLGSEKWDGLTDEERIGVLKTVVKIERCSLGISFGVELITGELEERTAACYDHDRHAIILNADTVGIRSAEEMLATVCHEMYHAYQYDLLALYHATDGKYRRLTIFDDVRTYESEFRDYYGNEEDGDDYYYQTCEILARDYAENESRRYFRFIALSEWENDRTKETGELQDGKER